ncbi:WD repeat-containing protein 6 [Frankliniella fusca]|uniref:tRNA (34-2'-O)-methyltransferase regulator WDR6 n=1 Tax=Frankliniella fusca TaxID=407009 RepID=A0AAE1I4U3_9NEOP|nr:WD repeat-containing protein 6 [Frankliniella fusca]
MDLVSVRNSFLCTDVVCVKCYRSFVFAGVGGFLKVFDLNSNRCVKELEIFKGHKIYGIAPSEDHIIIFGSKSVKIFLFKANENDISLKCLANLTLEDWILAVHWISSLTQIILVTAHNVAWVWSWKSNSNLDLKRSDCHEKCILYSATICGNDWSSCVVFAGTVFREIVLWLPGGNIQGDQPVLHRLEGHNGVIFSLIWDWESSSLCSTSDDRSIRLWNIDLPDKTDWKRSAVSCSQIFYGHSARVWRSIIIQDFIVSVGEDCQVCVWSRKGKLLQSLERSSSGCQWSVDFSSEHQLLVTGAGDGSIQLLPFSFHATSSSIHQVFFKNDLVKSSPSKPRKLVLLSVGCIATVTEDGTVLCGYPTNPSTWAVICKDDRFSNYCLLSVAPNRKKFSLASLKGHVLIKQGFVTNMEHSTLEQKLEDGKIWSLLWLSSDQLLVCGDEGRLSIWQLPQKGGVNLICVGRFLLPRSRERWPTCATVVHRDGKRFLLCGDRCGSLHLFSFQMSASQQHLPADHSLSKLHGKLGSTNILEIDHQILSTGRDGIVRTITIDSKSLQMSVMSNDKMIVDWVCAILPVSSISHHLLFVGFKETNMIVWSSKERRTIFQLDCGGGHRSWDCIISNSKKLEIVFVREKYIYYSSQSLEALMKPTLQQGISSRELNCISVLPNHSSSILLGGEDGSVYLCNFLEDLSRLKNKITLTSHISSVRCVCVHNKFFFTAGGRAQLKAWCVEVGLENEILCAELASHMLKGERNSRSPPSVDPEMRYMTLITIPSFEDDPVVYVVSGCSDGALRWMTFDSTKKTFKLFGESMFHGKCVLKLLTVLIEERTFLVSTATDGRIALWNVGPDMFYCSEMLKEPVFSHKCHQSGVNSIQSTICSCGEKTVLVLASGGDDNCVVLSALNVGQKDAYLIAKWCSSSAHAAQVTGVWLSGQWLISTSIDQRLTIWSWCLLQAQTPELKCNFLYQTISSVPDIQDLQVWQKGNLLCVCVVGKGVQIFTIPINNEFQITETS